MKPKLFVENMKIPKVFFDDHWGRDLTVTKRIEKNGLKSVVVKETKQHYFVSLTEEEFHDLFGDAEHYAWMSAHGEYRESFGLVRSATATLKAMNKTLEAK